MSTYLQSNVWDRSCEWRPLGAQGSMENQNGSFFGSFLEICWRMLAWGNVSTLQYAVHLLRMGLHIRVPLPGEECELSSTSTISVKANHIQKTYFYFWNLPIYLVNHSWEDLWRRSLFLKSCPLQSPGDPVMLQLPLTQKWMDDWMDGWVDGW